MISIVVLALLFLGLDGEETKVRVEQHKNRWVRSTTTCSQQNQAILSKLNELQGIETKLTELERKVDMCNAGPSHCSQGVPKNCAEVLPCSGPNSGVYTIDPDDQGSFQVYCDQTTLGGGWTVFQKRQDGSVDFYRGWSDYKQGFGNLAGEFWLGLDKINRLTNQARNKLRVELEDITGASAYAEYGYFAVTAEPSKYQLSLGTYSGTAGDSLSGHRGYAFSTKDKDNDGWSGGNCAAQYKGGWWYTYCHASNLNGLYHHGSHTSHADGVNWHAWKGHYYSAKRAEMKIRPQGFIVPH